MNYKAYIQTFNNIPQDDWAFAAYQTFKDKGTKVILFEHDEIESIPVSKFNIVVANFSNTIFYFKELGIEVPKPLNIPPVLLPYALRKIEIKSVKEFNQTVTLPIFIKPANDIKSFMAGVLQDEHSLKSFHFFNEKENVTDETMIMTSEVIDIVSEYRGFVINNELKALHYYKGDFKEFPDVDVIEHAIRDYKDKDFAPAGYSIDFGVTSNGDTVLIECNDGWSLGNYGCNPDIYTNLLIKRWLELTKSI